jgi:hypothetical protein
MRLFVTVIAVLFFSLSSPSAGHKQQSKAQENRNDATPASNPSSPVTVVVGQPFTPPQKESTQAQAHDWHDWFWPPIWSNWGLIIVAAIAAHAALKTLGGIDAQVVEMRNTGEQTEKLIKENIAQSASLERSVKETARFATAMEGVAESLKKTAELSSETVKGLKLQMRAYVTTSIGGAVFQERNKNIRFAASPLFNNNGLTPAHRVRHRSKAAVLPIPLPVDFDYPVPDAASGEALMAPRQQNVVNIIVDDFIDDSEVASVKSGIGQGLYVWGVIEYDDVFGNPQQTRYCQFLNWLPDGKTVWGSFIPGHNDGT